MTSLFITPSKETSAPRDTISFATHKMSSHYILVLNTTTNGDGKKVTLMTFFCSNDPREGGNEPCLKSGFLETRTSFRMARWLSRNCFILSPMLGNYAMATNTFRLLLSFPINGRIILNVFTGDSRTGKPKSSLLAVAWRHVQYLKSGQYVAVITGR